MPKKLTKLHRFKISSSMKGRKQPWKSREFKLNASISKRVIDTESGREFVSVGHAAKFAGVNKSMMSDHLNGKHKTCRGRVYKFKSPQPLKKETETEAGLNGIPVVDTETGEEYPSITYAANKIGVTKASLSQHLSGRNKTCRGKIYKFKDQT